MIFNYHDRPIRSLESHKQNINQNKFENTEECSKSVKKNISWSANAAEMSLVLRFKVASSRQEELGAASRQATSESSGTRRYITQGVDMTVIGHLHSLRLTWRRRRWHGSYARHVVDFTPLATCGDCYRNKSATSWPSQRSTTTLSAGTAVLTGSSYNTTNRINRSKLYPTYRWPGFSLQGCTLGVVSAGSGKIEVPV